MVNEIVNGKKLEECSQKLGTFLIEELKLGLLDATILLQFEKDEISYAMNVEANNRRKRK